MKKLYYVEAQKLLYTCGGVRHYDLYLVSMVGFDTALWKFQELKFLRNCYGNYKNIVLYRYDGKGNRVYLRHA